MEGGGGGGGNEIVRAGDGKQQRSSVEKHGDGHGFRVLNWKQLVIVYIEAGKRLKNGAPKSVSQLIGFGSNRINLYSR